MKKKLLMLVLTGLCFGSVQAQQASTFIVKSDEKKLNKHSANTLKEMLGETARDLFKHSISLSKQLGHFHVAIASKKETARLHQELGTWQVEVASLQQHCSEVLEKLIENQKPFKKASKQELQGAYKRMQEALSLVGTLLTQIKTEQSKLEVKQDKSFDDLVNGVVLSVQICVTQTKSVQTSFNTHSCLKLA